MYLTTYFNVFHFYFLLFLLGKIVAIEIILLKSIGRQYNSGRCFDTQIEKKMFH